jgi:hypothetical protein
MSYLLPHMFDYGCVTLPQAHTQLECTTLVGRTSGTIEVSTSAGRASVGFDVGTLTQSANITAVTPAEWSTTKATRVVIIGER